MNLYLAGPFFNPRQKEAAELVASLAKAAGWDFYAPVLNAYQGKIDDSCKARKVFLDNVARLGWADIVLAHLDWLTPTSLEVRVVSRAKEEPENSELFRAVSNPLNVPDAGTVWELGYAFCRKQAGVRPFTLIGYTFMPGFELNLMLSRSLDGFLRGSSQVKEFLKTGNLSESQKKYAGEEI